MQLTMLQPQITWKSLRRGQEVPGRIVGRTKLGDFFVDIGYVKQVMLRAKDVTGLDLAELKPGRDGKVQIKQKHQRSSDIDVALAALAPELAATPRRGIV